MKFFTALLPLLAVTEAANVILMDIKRNTAVEGKILNARGLGKRSGTITQSLINNITAGSYLAEVKVGTPPQTMTLALDTGSSDVWVVSSDAEICLIFSNDGPQCVDGTFDSSASSTFDDILPGAFSITYEDDTGAEGDYFTDNLSFGNVTISKLQMGLGDGQTTIPQGIMGIGYDTDEASEGVQGGTKYPNIIDQLVNQKLINIEAYSLWLDDLNASTGSILFGGIDTAKYTGSLLTIPVQADPQSGTTNISSFTVALTGLTTSNNNGDTIVNEDPIALPVVLDSGTTLTYLPTTLAESIYTEFGVINDLEESGNIIADCSIGVTGANSSVNFQFGSSSGPVISVGINELLFAIPTKEFPENEEPPFENNCLFGIFPQDGGPYLLGDTFLRSAYVVYDLKNNEIGLAASSFNSEDSNIVEFAATASEIPEASGIASGVSVTQTATGLPGIGGLPTSTSGSSFVSTAITTGASSPASTSRSASSFASSISTHTSSLASAASKSSAGTASPSSGSSAAGSVPAFGMGGLGVLGVSIIFSLIGRAWVVI